MILSLRVIRNILMSAAMLFLQPISVSCAEGSLGVIKAVQQKLNDFGYNVGTPDGKAGKKTLAAIRKFQEEFRLPADEQVSDVTAAQLEISPYFPEMSGEIIMLPDQINDIYFELRGLAHVQLINYVYQLSQKSVSKIDTNGAIWKTVVFVLSADLKTGDIVTTQVEGIRSDLPTTYDNFYYEITEDTPTEPLIIINQATAGLEYRFTHRMFVNGVLVAQKRTRAAK